VAYLGYYAVYVIAWYLSASITGHPIAVQANNVSFLREGNALILLVYALVNPCFEELIVRAYTMTELAAFKLPEGSIILLSVLLQAGYHLYQGAPAALLGSSLFFVFALYYAATRRALPIILAHLYFDLFALVGAR
jgi:membrane protease YdiL (CAAX protease family)